MNPAEVLDHKADLMVRLENPILRKAWRQQVYLDFADPAESKVSTLDNTSARNNAAVTMETLRKVLPEAEAFHVSRDMTQLTSYAASQLEPLDRIDRTIMPTRSGIVRFDGGLPFQDVRGKQMRISWVVWGPILVEEKRHDAREPGEATMLWMFNDHRDEPDEVAQWMYANDPAERIELMERVMGRWGFTGAQSIFEGQRLGPAWQPPPEDKAAEVLAEGFVPTEYSNLTRLIHAFWLLTGQTVAEKSDAAVDRPRRKRAIRANIPPRVVVIKLRNAKTSRAEGESLVEWSHRWVVRGFWRWQVCGPNHPLAQEIQPGVWRARIWIAPYVKGPSGKPLVVSEKVYALMR